MKQFILFMFYFFCIHQSMAQSTTTRQLNISSSTIFKDQHGNHITFVEFNRLTSAPGYRMEPLRIEGSEVKEMMVITPSIADVPSPNTMPVVAAARTASAAPLFALNDMGGNVFDLAAMQGKIVVLKFWFTACQPCIKEIPQLNALVAKYKGDNNVVFAAPCLDNSEVINSFLSRKSFNYRILPNARHLTTSYGVFGYPTHIVIGKDGAIKAVFSGVNTSIEHLLDDTIQKELLGETEVDNISSNDVIKDEKGNILDYDSFINMVNTGIYAPVRRQDVNGKKFILLKRKVN